MPRTVAGRSWQALIMSGASASGSVGTGDYAPADYLALTSDSDSPDPGDTSLDGELGGTLARAQGTSAHTGGTDTYTLTRSFTSDSSVTISKVGVFNAPTTGTMVFESLLDTPAVLESGDTLVITVTVTV